MPERFHFVKFEESYWKQFKSAAKKLGIDPVEFVHTAAKERANVVLNRERPVDAKRRARNARIKAETKTKAVAAEAELRRIEALRPDHEKLLAIAATVEAITVPPVSVNAAMVASGIETLLAGCAAGIRAAANSLVGD